MTRNRILPFAPFLAAGFLAVGCGPGSAAPSITGSDLSVSPGPTPTSPTSPGDSGRGTGSPSGSTPTRADLPAVLFSQPEALLAARAEARSGATVSPALVRLRADAEQALTVGPFTVTDKPQVAASGDKHDYLSLGRYWWPNPDTKDGLPYVQVDGQINPETETITDKAELQKLLPTVSTLAHAYFVFGDERYAEHVATLLRTWFLDPQTRMNPNLEYSQIHKGHTDMLGGSGIIDSRDFGVIPEALGLMKESKAWTAEDDSQLRAWFTQYLDWYLNSPGGKDEEASSNNHRTFYWYQAIPLAVYTGQDAFVDEVLRGRLTQSLEEQIMPDGSQPLELKRTKPFSYSTFNLMAWSRVAMIAESRGIDLWNHQGKGGRGSIKKAFEYLLPYARGEQELTDNPANPERMPDFARLLNGAALKYGESSWSGLARSIMAERSAELDLDLIVAPPTR